MQGTLQPMPATVTSPPPHPLSFENAITSSPSVMNSAVAAMGGKRLSSPMEETLSPNHVHCHLLQLERAHEPLQDEAG